MPHVDVAVIGGGPVGLVTAMAHARRGASVALLEANPGRKNRFAGELLHPPAVRALQRIGIDVVAPAEDHPHNHGFAVFGPERDAPYLLRHRQGVTGRTFEFNRFVAFLREHALGTTGITALDGARVTAVDGHDVTFLGPSGEQRLTAGRVVAADGRFSAVRKALGLPDDRTPLSHMAGLVLRGVTLPEEGHGHVMLGGEGPVLAYRIGEDEVRVILDVPPWIKRTKDRGARILRHVAHQLPPELRPAVEAELAADRIVWAVVDLRPRTTYGVGPVALVGDAVGHYHPMTGIGMTLGFGDAVALADHDDLDAWARERRRDTLSPALLATALYEIFAVDAPPTRACRRAIFDLWYSPQIRARSVDFLTAEDTSFRRLLGVGTQLVARACWHAAADAGRSGGWRAGAGHMGRIAGLVQWLLTESVPPSMRLIAPDAGATPFEAVRLAARGEHLAGAERAGGLA